MVRDRIPIFALYVMVGALLLVSRGFAEEAEITRDLSGKGAKFVEAKGVVTQASIHDATTWTDGDFKKLAQLSHLQSLDFAKGLTDQQLAMLAPLGEVTYFSTNAGAVSDADTKSFSQFKKLRTLKFFHPGPAFTGAGLSQLADLPDLKSLTVAGSVSFADEGMAAAAKLPHLTELRTWHAGQTTDGVAKLKAIKTLTNLNLGQRLAYKPPITVSDDTVAIVSEIPTLEVLQLSEARLSLDALRKLKALPRLKTLTLDGIQISEADVKTLTSELPNVQIKWTAPNEAYLRRIKALFPNVPAAIQQTGASESPARARLAGPS